jgi:hypothetical protein
LFLFTVSSLWKASETTRESFGVQLDDEHVPENRANSEDDRHAPFFERKLCASEELSTIMDKEDLSGNHEDGDREEPFVEVNPFKIASSYARISGCPGFSDGVEYFFLVQNPRVEEVKDVHEDNRVENNSVHLKLSSTGTFFDKGHTIVLFCRPSNVACIPVEGVFVRVLDSE